MACRFGVDGISVGLMFMGAVVAFAAACCSFEIKEREKEFYILLLVMTGGILGAFASLDLFFFYFFHELALVPTFIMIGVWGRGERKNYATFQITLYLSLGALMALVGLIALYLQSGANTFDISTLTRHLRQQPLSQAAQQFIFPLLLFGFGILVSLWPFHTWAPLAYGSAPTATAMLHAGVLKKFGLYGLLRLALPLMPDAASDWMPVVAWLCLGNLVYCGWVAMRQKNFNWLIGYSSVAHMGFVFLGLATLTLVGVTGAVLVMIAHGFLARAHVRVERLPPGTDRYPRNEGTGRPAAQTAVHRHRADHGGVRRLRPAGVREFCRRNHGSIRRLESVPARDCARLLGRADHWRGVHAARGAGGVARAAGREQGLCGECDGCRRVAQSALRIAARRPAGVWLFPAFADRQDRPGGGTDREHGDGEGG